MVAHSVTLLVAGLVLSAEPSQSGAAQKPVSPQSAPADTDRQFAVLLERAIRAISKHHVTSTSAAQMARWALDRLYKHVKEPLPPTIAARTRALKEEDAKQLVDLLHDARTRLGSRAGLDCDTALRICLAAIFSALEPGARPMDRSTLRCQGFI